MSPEFLSQLLDLEHDEIFAWEFEGVTDVWWGDKQATEAEGCADELCGALYGALRNDAPQIHQKIVRLINW